MDVDGDGQSDLLLVAAPMYYKQGWEGGKVYVYSVTPEVCLPDRCSQVSGASNVPLGTSV